MRKLLDTMRVRGAPKMLLIALLVVLALLAGRPAGRTVSGALDRLLYDAVVTWYARGAPTNIVMVNIDARTVAALGLSNLPGDPERLLAQLGAAGSVVLDVPMLPAQNYTRLEAAMRRHGRVILVLPSTSQEAPRMLPSAPWNTLRGNAAAIAQRDLVLGHFGTVSGFVPYATMPDGVFAHVALTALQTVGVDRSADVLKYVRPAANRDAPGQFRTDYVLAMLHQQDDVTQYSYLDVIEGRVPQQAFADKIVFVGHSAWLGEGRYPLSLLNRNFVPRAYLDLLFTDAIARHHLVRELPDSIEMLIYAALTAGMIVICLRFSGRVIHVIALAWCIALVVIPPLLLTFRIWLPVGLLPVICLLIYGYFAWERHSSMVAMMRTELSSLRSISESIGTLPASALQATETADGLDDVQTAMRQIRSWQKIYVDMINQLPYPVFLALEGKVAVWNARAAEYIGDATPARTGAARERVAPIEDAIAESLRTGGDVSREIAWDGRTHLLLCEPLSNPAETDDSVAAAHDDAQRSHLVCLIEVDNAVSYDTQVLRHIAHDLRSPLTSILALIEHRHEEQDGSGDQAFLRDLRRQADYSLRIANGFVQLSRAERLSDSAFEPVMLEDLAVDAVGQTLVAARKKSISLHGPSGDVGDTLIHGDAHMLMRALVNVIDNAIKYSPPRTAIDVRIERIGDAELALHVGDQGIGIPAEALQRLFEPFFQVERGRREDGGVGLGLPFVKAVVERHRGTVEVSSVPRRGTDFVIRLPLYRQSDSGRTGT
ncbi:hypothetical protein NL30_37270 [Burkholderia contaminans]|uniref:ATP-binding protein n=1 Tax=Burkholderia contaminans TaxID=488447 RepID=UPI000655B7DF|nr:ATP-binding protein [Burkholderia contaminans]AKM45460.1 hypothetical protein NL30_37270 [Burkholderia contaminans]